jgi:hypothetical protein
VTVFPWLSGVLLLLLIAAAISSAATAFISLARERRFSLRRPTMRATLLLTALEIVLLVLWVFTLRIS